MFGVRRKMLVVRVSALQMRIVRMRLRVVPVQFLFATPDLVPIPVDDDRQAIVQDSLSHDQADVVIEEQFTSNTREGRPPSHKRNCGAADGKKLG